MKLYLHRWRQNLKNDDRTRCLFYQRGTWWLRRRTDDTAIGSVHWSLLIPSRRVGASLQLDANADDPITAHIGIGLFSLGLGLDSRTLHRLVRRVLPKRHYRYETPRGLLEGDTTIGHEIRIAFHDRAVWWNLWTPSMEWSSKTPRWRHGSWHPIETLLGKATASEREIQRATPVTIAMPEGAYTGTVRLFESIWTRPRWPWPTRIRRAEVDVPNPPLFAGKGENSWDQDDDGIYSMTTPAATVQEAIDAYRRSVLRNRERYGMPSQKREDHEE